MRKRYEIEYTKQIWKVSALFNLHFIREKRLFSSFSVPSNFVQHKRIAKIRTYFKIALLRNKSNNVLATFLQKIFYILMAFNSNIQNNSKWVVLFIKTAFYNLTIGTFHFNLLPFEIPKLKIPKRFFISYCSFRKFMMPSLFINIMMIVNIILNTNCIDRNAHWKLVK